MAWRSNKARWIATLCAALLLGACGQDTRDAEPETTAQRGTVVALVDGEPITEQALEQQIEQLFGPARSEKITPEIRRNVLESLIRARAIAQAAEREFSASELERIDLKAQLHREQLLVNAYLRVRVTPEPVTPAMVEAFYQRHPERFGGGRARSFELLLASDALSEPERGELLEALARAENTDNWDDLADELRRQGFDVAYRQGIADEEFLDDRLLGVVRALEPHQSSSPGLLNRRPFVVRALEDVEQRPEPLSQVSQEIRQALAGQQMQDAVSKATEPLLDEVKVEYLLSD